MIRGRSPEIPKSHSISGTAYPSSWLSRLLMVEPICLVLLSPFFIFPAPLTTPLFLVVPAFWWLRRKLTAHFIPRGPLDWVWLLLMLMVLVSLFVTFDLALSLPKIAGMILAIGLYYAYAGWASKPVGLHWSILIFLGIGAAMAGVGLLGMDWTARANAFQPLWTFSLPGAPDGIQPNEVAGALLWVLPLFFVMLVWWVIKRPDLSALIGKSRWLIFLIVGVFINCLMFGIFLLTESRSGYVGLGLALVASLILSLPSYLRRITLVISALLVVGLLVIVISNPAPFLNLLVGRTELWSRALYALQDFPFTGLGMNTFRSIVPRLYPLFLVGPQPDIGHAHNEFLQVGLDLGLPALIAFVALYLGAFWMLVKVWRAGSLDTLLFYRATALGLGGGLLAHLIYGLTDAVALGAKPGLLFWMLLGLISGLHRQTATFVPQST